MYIQTSFGTYKIGGHAQRRAMRYSKVVGYFMPTRPVEEWYLNG